MEAIMIFDRGYRKIIVKDEVTRRAIKIAAE